MPAPVPPLNLAVLGAVTAGTAGTTGTAFGFETKNGQQGQLDYTTLHCMTFRTPSKQISTERSTNSNQVITIFIKALTGTTIQMQAKPNDTVQCLKQNIHRQEKIPVDQQRLVFGGQALDNSRMTLAACGIEDNSIVFLVLRFSASSPYYCVDPNTFAPEFDFDFTNERCDGKKYVRGGEVYRRPYGWNRLAIQVLGRYDGGSNAWLGPDGIRTESCVGEWPVSYHGTGYYKAKSIADEGYKLLKHERFAYGKGVYTSPDIDVAEKYATKHELPGKVFILVVMQNRVNPASLKKIQTSVGEYWVSSNDTDVRPYGICIKVVTSSQPRLTSSAEVRSKSATPYDARRKSACVRSASATAHLPEVEVEHDPEENPFLTRPTRTNKKSKSGCVIC